MTRSPARRLHIPIDPPVQTRIAGHRVTFDGLNLIRLRVMVEYNVDPPIEPVRAIRLEVGTHVIVALLAQVMPNKHVWSVSADEPGGTSGFGDALGDGVGNAALGECSGMFLGGRPVAGTWSPGGLRCYCLQR